MTVRTVGTEDADHTVLDLSSPPADKSVCSVSSPWSSIDLTASRLKEFLGELAKCLGLFTCKIAF